MNEIDDSQAPLLDHLVELRRRLLYSVVAVGLCFGLCFYFSEQILSFLVQPLLAAGQKRVIFTQIFDRHPDGATDIWQMIAPCKP